MVPRLSVLVFVLTAVPFFAAAQEKPTATSQPVAASQEQQSVEELIKQARDHRAAGALNDALALLATVLQRDPVNSEAKLLSAEILMDINRYDDARNLFKQVLDVEPSNFRANVGYGKILAANRSWRQATNYLERAEQVAPEPQRCEAKRLLAVAYGGMGELATAISKTKEAIQIDATNLDARRTLVELRQAAASRDPGQLENLKNDAETYTDKALEAVRQKPWEKEGLQRLDNAYELAMGALRMLHNSYYESVRGQVTDKVLPGKDGEVAATLVLIADKLRRQAAVKATLVEHDALMLLQKAVEVQPKNIRCLEELGAAYQRIKDQERAVQTYRKLLELDPNHAEARQYLESVGAPLTAPPAPAEATSQPGG